MKVKKTAALENVNLFLLNQRIDEYIAESGLTPIEGKCRMVQVVLRHKVHHFPVGIPFIAVVKKCAGEQQVVFNIKRSKLSSIQDIDIAAETRVTAPFTIDNVNYEQIDTINGFARFQPTFSKKTKKK